MALVNSKSTASLVRHTSCAPSSSPANVYHLESSVRRRERTVMYCCANNWIFKLRNATEGEGYSSNFNRPSTSSAPFRTCVIVEMRGRIDCYVVICKKDKYDFGFTLLPTVSLFRRISKTCTLTSLHFRSCLSLRACKREAVMGRQDVVAQSVFSLLLCLRTLAFSTSRSFLDTHLLNASPNGATPHHSQRSV